MTVNDHDFCRCALALARDEARDKEVEIPSLVVDPPCGRLGVEDPWRYVRYKATGKVAWEGPSCCAWWARAQAIWSMIKAAEAVRGEENDQGSADR